MSAQTHGVTFVGVGSAAEMADAVLSRSDADLVIMAAAVADYTPAERSDTKVKKADGDLSIALRRTTDILATSVSTEERELPRAMPFDSIIDCTRLSALCSTVKATS